MALADCGGWRACGFGEHFERVFHSCFEQTAADDCRLFPVSRSLIPDILLFRYRFNCQRLCEERAGAGLLVLDAHADGGESCRTAQATVFKEEDGDFVGLRAGLQDDGAELAEWADELGGERADLLDALHLCMDLRGRFEFKIGGGLFALSAEMDETAFAARSQKTFYRSGLFCVALVGAALVARSEAHFHLGVDAAGIARVGIEIEGAAAQEEELERFFRIALGGGARGERS